MPDMTNWFYDGWPGIVRVAVAALIAYPTLILFLRLSGKRTLSKMNAFDFVITVATGSTMAAVILNDSVSLLEGTAAFVMLVGLQYSVAFIAARSRRFAEIIKGKPSLLLWDGRLDEAMCRRERITPPEVDASLRSAGLARRGQAQAVILETTGDLFVIPAEKADPEFTPDDGTLEPVSQKPSAWL